MRLEPVRWGERWMAEKLARRRNMVRKRSVEAARSAGECLSKF